MQPRKKNWMKQICELTVQRNKYHFENFLLKFYINNKWIKWLDFIEIFTFQSGWKEGDINWESLRGSSLIWLTCVNLPVFNNEKSEMKKNENCYLWEILQWDNKKTPLNSLLRCAFLRDFFPSSFVYC